MATRILFANNASTTLAQGVSSTATVINVASGDGDLFPSPDTDEMFPVTFVDAATGLINEITYCTSRSGDALTVTRGQEGTTARAWLAGDTFSNLITAETIEEWLQENDLDGYATESWAEGEFLQLSDAATQTVTGPVTFEGDTEVPDVTDFTSKNALNAETAEGRYATQTNLTTEQTTREDADTELQTQIDGCVPTRPDDTDATEGRIDWLIYNKTLQQPVAFTPSLSLGLALLVSQTFNADGYSTISNLVYRQSDGVLQVSVGSISAGVIADFAPVSSVAAVASDLSDETAARIAAIAAEQTDRANADATLQSQVDVRISTNASDDGTNSPLPFIAMNDATGAPFAKLADGTSFRMVPSRPGSGYNSIDNISTGSDGTLIVADSSGAGPAYKPTETGTIPGGWYYKVGNLLVLNYTLSVVQAGSYTFPMAFSSPPVVQLTALAFDSQATTINLNGAPTATGFGILSSYWSGTQHDSGTNTIHVTATGVAA